jgi:microcystin-dependent protein
MPYQILKSDGTILTEIADGTIDNISTSISLIGKNVVGFGQPQNSDFVHMLENFAYGVPPVNPLVGQLWFDTVTNALHVYNNGWQTLGSITYDSVPPVVAVQGNLWFDTGSNILKINTGTGFINIGPEGVSGFSTTKFSSVSLVDTNNTTHAVIECIVNGEVIAIISRDAFDISYINAVDGFPSVNRGITLKNYTSSDVELFGYSKKSQSSNALLDEGQTVYLTASSTSAGASIMQRNSSGNTKINELTASKLTSFSNAGVLSGSWFVDTSITPLTTNSVDLGTQSLSWKTIWTNGIQSQNISTNSLNVNGVVLSSATFTNLISVSNKQTISKFDTDGTLSENLDSNISTQKATKTYIDNIVSSLTATIANLQSQITSLVAGYTGIPSGTVMYIAGGSVPPGFLLADGSSVGIDQYHNLYMALGGAASPYGVNGASFTLPDLRGYFIRGADYGAGRDPGRQYATTQGDNSVIKSHFHVFPGDDQLGYANGSNGWTNATLGSFNYDARSQLGGGGQLWLTGNSVDSSGNSLADTGETRPKNIALFGVIKT